MKRNAEQKMQLKVVLKAVILVKIIQVCVSISEFRILDVWITHYIAGNVIEEFILATGRRNIFLFFLVISN